MFTKKAIKSLLAIAILNCSHNVFAEQVDLLLLYDEFTRDRYNGAPMTTMTAWVENANAAYVASQVDIQLRLVGLEFYSPSVSSISDQLTEIRRSSEVNTLRNQFGADFVALIAARDGNICGIGNFAVSATAAFNVTGVQCGYLTLIHELGHNMGLAHSRRQGDTRGVRYDYGLGYGVDREFATVMAYPQSFSTNTRLNRFSDPARACEGFTCGVAIGNSEQSDAHTALNNVRLDIANFRDSVDGGTPTTTPTPTPTTPVTVPAPSNTVASVQAQNITINWRDNSTGEDFFEIQRSISQNSGFTQIATTAQGVATYSDNNLATAQTYYYRVRASLDGTTSDWSNVATATTEGNVVVDVPAPSNLQVSTASANSINLSWSDNSINENFFEIERSINSSNAFTSLGTVGRSSTGYLDQNLSPNTYYYRVRASKDNVLSEWSNIGNTTINSTGEPTIPPETGTGINLLEQGFRVYTSQRGSDGRGYITNDGASLSLQNNIWVATSTRFNITPTTILSCDYSSNVSIEIHGIGLDENNTASSNRIFKLGGSQNWGISDFEYTGNGDVQHFDIPVGQYYTGSMRLVMANDNDSGSGNVGYYSNIMITDSSADSNLYIATADISTDYDFGLEAIDGSTATLYHVANNQANIAHELCIDNDCAPGEWKNGRYERVVNITTNESYLLEYQVDVDRGQCNISTIVNYTVHGAGLVSSQCK